MTIQISPFITARRRSIPGAQFYIGEQQLLRGQKPAAKQSFKAVADLCPKNETAYVGALAELGRLGE